MQKLPEVSDRKKGQRLRKEKGTSRQKEEAHSFSASDQWSDSTLLTSGTTRIRLWTLRWLVLSIVALVSVNSMPKYKSYEMDQLNYKLKHLDKLPKATNTLLKILNPK